MYRYVTDRMFISLVSCYVFYAHLLGADDCGNMSGFSLFRFLTRQRYFQWRSRNFARKCKKYQEICCATNGRTQNALHPFWIHIKIKAIAACVVVYILNRRNIKFFVHRTFYKSDVLNKTVGRIDHLVIAGRVKFPTALRFIYIKRKRMRKQRHFQMGSQKIKIYSLRRVTANIKEKVQFRVCFCVV